MDPGHGAQPAPPWPTSPPWGMTGTVSVSPAHCASASSACLPAGVVPAPGSPIPKAHHPQAS